MKMFTAWSFSMLEAFGICPRKYKAERIDRSIKEAPNQQRDYGQEAHKAFENRLLKGKQLPLDLRHHEENLAKIAAAPGKGYPEQKLGITAEYKPTGFFDDDVWCRGIVDYLKTNGDHAVLIDHKFGKMKHDPAQLRLCSALVLATLPEIMTIQAAYYWAKSKKFTKTTVTRYDIPNVWNEFLPRVNKMKEAYRDEEFPARPCFLCRNHCQVTGCEHHGHSN